MEVKGGWRQVECSNSGEHCSLELASTAVSLLPKRPGDRHCPAVEPTHRQIDWLSGDCGGAQPITAAGAQRRRATIRYECK